MNKVERIKAAINGRECDVLPYAIWTHLPGIDLDPVLLAENTYDFFKKYDIDFVKTMNNGMYPVENFDCEVDFSDIKNGGVAKLFSTPIKDINDWKRIEPVNINKGAFGRELKSLKLLKDKIKSEAPIVFTIFSPITIANKLSKNKLLEHMELGQKNLIHHALNIITESTANLAKKAIELGADGIFFATQMSSYDVAEEKIYKEFGVKYDLKVLEAASEGWVNVLHAHGNNIMFNLLKEYPVHVFNWHAWETLPELLEARDITGKCLMGGIKRMDITNGNKNEIHNQIYNAIRLLERRKHILTPGCVIRYPLDDEILSFIKEVKIDIENKLFISRKSQNNKEKIMKQKIS